MFFKTWLRRDRKKYAPKNPLHLTVLEDRLAPALTIKIDYSLDSSGFFADATRRSVLEQAANDLASRIVSTPSAITPGGTNTWSAIFDNPSTGAQVKLPNLSIPQGTVVVFAGGADLPGSQSGEGGIGGFSYSGSATFGQSIVGRGGAAAGIWGGSLSMDTGTNWYFGSDPAGLKSGQVDFYSIAIHELGHVLGLGTAKTWHSLIQNGTFTGAAASSVYGGPVPVSADGGHWAQGITVGGQSVSMQPIAENAKRVGLSELDFAALQDIGWQVAGVGGGTAVTTTTPLAPTPAPTPATPKVTELFASDSHDHEHDQAPTPTTVEGGAKGERLVLVSGPNNGTLQAYIAGAGGRLTPHGGPFRPFGEFGGPVRAVAADVNGDGATDIVAATGPGGGSRLRILDGRTFQDIVPEFYVFEAGFTGGVFLAAGDFNKDGRDEVVVTPDQGGGPRVRILTLNGSQMQPIADFFGIEDPAFRGGARAAVGDINKDGTPDLVVSAGYGGGPRVSLVNGATLLSGAPQRLTADFFAFEPGLRNGVYATVADVNGDGHGDLVFGAGPGGGPRVLTVSGHTVTTAGATAAVGNPMSNLFAGNPEQRGGVRVAAKDLDGDGKAEVVTGSGVGGELRVYRGPGMSASEVLAPFGAGDLDGIYVG